MMYSVRDIRSNPALISDSRGLYKWWCKLEVLEGIANALQFDIGNCQIEKDDEYGLFCVYVGVAVKETLRKRIKWHMGNHTPGAVKHKTLSTLKQSLSAVVKHNMSHKYADELNDYMDNFFVSEDMINAAREDIYEEEKRLLSGLNQPLYILNIQENKHTQAPKKVLKKMRKNAWKKAMSDFS